jgi:hypothetical protein
VLSAQSKEFLIKKYSDLCELGVSVVKSCFSLLASYPAILYPPPSILDS